MTVRLLKVKYRRQEVAGKRRQWSSTSCSSSIRTCTEEDIAFEVYAVLHDIPKRSRPREREKFLSKGHPHLRVSALAKRYGWGMHNNADGKIALIAVESPEYRRLMNDPRTTKVKAFRSKRV